MLTCKGCIHANGEKECNRGCVTNNKRCGKYTRKNKSEAKAVTEEKAEFIEERNEVAKLELDDGYRCKRQCADHRNYLCPKNDVCVCLGMCRGRIAAGRCSGCERFERIAEAA